VRKQFTGYERDSEADLDFAENRCYNFNHGRFTSVDPILISKGRLQDPQQLNLYVYARNNPLKFIDPDGRYFVGTDGKKVEVNMKDGKIIVGRNASKDLKRLAGLVSKAGSKTALEIFSKVANNVTKVNFGIVTEKVDNGLGGLHQAHDSDGKALTWIAGEKGSGHFDGTVSFVKDDKGNDAYKETTITIFEGNIKGSNKQETKDAIVSVFAHEGEHDTDQNSINAIKERQEGGRMTLTLRSLHIR
jgi:RHS repeat-associated protein